MIEKIYNFKSMDTKLIEKVIADENVAINHMVLPKGDALPEHYSNSHVYMIVVQGIVSLQLNDQEIHSYPQGSIVNIPYKTKMNVSNKNDELLEFFVVKAPSPAKMES